MLNMLKVGASFYGLLFTSDATGALVDADVLPTAQAFRNGALDAGYVLTVTNVGTGRYTVIGAVPIYTPGDVVNIQGLATVSGVAGGGPVGSFQVVSDAIYDAVISGAMAELTGEPGATPDMAEALMWLYMASRNERATSGSADTVKNNAGADIASASLADVSGTFTKGKYS